MYATCLFCNGNLGRNEVIEAFPVGRRLAFDAAKGRLWVVCRKCERWNLTPLEERWEAIEACERAFRATTLRVSTDEIGMARLKEGLELVRIGAPQRPEMAAWRYGDQFGRRRRRHIALVAGGVAVAGIVVVAGPMLGLVSAGAINPALNLFNAARGIYRARTFIRIPGDDDGAVLRMRLRHLEKVRVAASGDAFVLRVPTDPTRGVVPWWHFDRSIERHELRELTGGAALRAAGALLPRLNQAGGSASEVQRAVGLLEANATPDRLFRGAAERRARGRRRSESVTGDESLLSKLPRDLRLALEMAAHEESERRALEGELHLLEAAWRDAEEIAGIADDMFLPASVDEDLARLKRQRDAGPTDAGSG